MFLLIFHLLHLIFLPTFSSCFPNLCRCFSPQDTPLSKSSDVTSVSGTTGKGGKRRSVRAKGGKGTSMETGRVASSALDDELGFEISTKVKGLKKLKESSGRSNFGGDIYQPNTLELPYTLKHIRQKDSDRPKENHRNPKGTTNKVSYRNIYFGGICELFL